MPTADFAAAQERLATRRRQRVAKNRAREDAQRAAQASSLSRLPDPLNRLGGLGSSLWESVKSREGTRPAFRVGQVDAELLDEELLDLLRGQVGDGLKYFGSHLRDDYAPEILLALRAILFKLTIWDHNASYGASLQGLRYTDARNTNSSRPLPKPWQKAVYGLITVGGHYGWNRWEDHLMSRTDNPDYMDDPQTRFASRLTTAISNFYSVAAMASFLVFLVNGRYRTILDRVLRLRLTPTTHATSREVSFEYLNRQLVWHAFTEFLLFLLPLVGVSRWRRILSRSWRKAKRFVQSNIMGQPQEHDDEEMASGELHFLPERTCAICYQDQNPSTGTTESDLLAASGAGGVVGSAATDITNPYETVPCGCVYCYVCLAQRIDAEEGEGWTCLRCGETVRECKPWNGDIVVEVTRPSSNGGKTVGFAADLRDNGNVDPDPESEDESVNDHELDITGTGTPASMEEIEPEVLEDKHHTSGLLGLHESEEWARAEDDSS